MLVGKNLLALTPLLRTQESNWDLHGTCMVKQAILVFGANLPRPAPDSFTISIYVLDAEQWNPGPSDEMRLLCDLDRYTMPCIEPEVLCHTSVALRPGGPAGQGRRVDEISWAIMVVFERPKQFQNVLDSSEDSMEASQPKKIQSGVSCNVAAKWGVVFWR